MAIVAHQVTYRGGSDGNVPAITDRRLYDFLLSNSTGVVEGLTPSPSSSGEYKFSAGWGFIQGCMFTVDNTLSVEMLATSSDTASRVIARLNVALSTIEFEEQLQPYPALVQEDILHNGSIYEVVMARFTLNGRNVSAATMEMPMLVGMAEYATELTALRALVDPAVAKLATIEEGAQVNTVTGVKGTKESSYRTGNVSLTPANIGAVPTTRTVNGKELSSNITISKDDLGLANVNPVIIGDGAYNARDFLVYNWNYFPNGISLISYTESASANKRHTFIVNKISTNTGHVLAFTNVLENDKAVIRLFIVSGTSMFTAFTFTSD